MLTLAIFGTEELIFFNRLISFIVKPLQADFRSGTIAFFNIGTVHPPPMVGTFLLYGAGEYRMVTVSILLLYQDEPGDPEQYYNGLRFAGVPAPPGPG